jgi:hypothetical protein
MVMVVGMIAPAPRPCTTRNAISGQMLQATPHMIEPSRNRPMPQRITGLRPNRSFSLP